MNLETLAIKHAGMIISEGNDFVFGLDQLRELIKEVVGEPVAYRFSKGPITKLDSWKHGGGWKPLYAINLEEL